MLYFNYNDSFGNDDLLVIFIHYHGFTKITGPESSQNIHIIVKE
jgi:hypothetical protein